MKRKLLLPALAGVFLLASCGQEKDDDFPKLPSRQLEGLTFVARVSQGPLNDGTAYYALSFTNPARYTITRLDTLGMPTMVEEYGTFVFVQGNLGKQVRLYPYDSQNWSKTKFGLPYDEKEGTIVEQNRTYRRRP